jgi:signal transduction histidine kinase
VLNLLGNAADAVEAREGAQVRVRTWREGKKVRIEVADNGPGLDPSVAPRLFQPFVSTKEAGRGTGLGLSICRSIVESHGGSIEAASQADSGARFTVTLPAGA